MVTLFYISPFGQTRWLLSHLTEYHVPILNEILGDKVHADFDASVRLAMNIARDPEIDDKGMHVIAFAVEERIYQALIRSGDIRPEADKDALGADLVCITANGAEVLNGCIAGFSASEHMRPEKLN